MAETGSGRKHRDAVIGSIFFVIFLILSSCSLLHGAGTKNSKLITLAFSSSIVSDANLKDTKLAMEIWSQKLTRKMGFDYRTEVKFYKDYPSLIDAARKGEMDFVQLNMVEYLNIKKQVPVEPLLISVKNGRDSESLLLLVHRENPVKSLDELVNGRMVIERGAKGGVPELWLDTLLLRRKKPTQAKFFKTLEFEDNPSRAATKVYFRQADACVVTMGTFETMKEMNPQFGTTLRPLCTSAPMVFGAFFTLKSTDLQVKTSFAETGQNLAREVEGRQMLTLFRVDGIEPYKPEVLKNTIDLYNEHEALINRVKR